MTGAIQSLTTNFKMSKINFDFPNWAQYLNDNFDLIDALFSTYITSQGITGVWNNATDYVANDRTLDDVTGDIFVCQVAHTSGSTGSFEADRTAHPTYWRQLIYDPRSRGTWATATAYALNDFVVSGQQYAICEADHTSGATFAGDVSGGKWTVLIDLTAALATATTKASEASASATAAASSASAASGSASTASTAASAAATSASAAATSASTATTQATNAAASASTATTQATNAATSASTATTQATAASGSATAAAASAVAAAALVQTGMIMPFIQTTSVTGWVKADSGTIGDASSGATRANADTAALFTAIWNATTNSECQLKTSAGADVVRGASAAADYAAHRRIATPDMRGEFPRGLDAGRGVDTGRVNASAQAEMVGPHAHTLQFKRSDTEDSSGQNRVDHIGAGNLPNNSADTDNNTGTENRPRNVAFTYYIKL